MHDLQTMQDRQRRAVVQEFKDAVADGAYALAGRILAANPDLDAELLRLSPPVTSPAWGAFSEAYEAAYRVRVAYIVRARMLARAR